MSIDDATLAALAVPSHGELTRSELANLLADLLPENVPLLTRVTLSTAINTLPASELPTISRLFHEGMTIAKEQGIDAFCDFLRTLDVPEELIKVVRQYAPEQ